MKVTAVQPAGGAAVTLIQTGLFPSSLSGFRTFFAYVPLSIEEYDDLPLSLKLQSRDDCHCARARKRPRARFSSRSV